MADSRSPRPPMAKRLVFSYFLDWIVLIAVAAVATVLGRLDAHKRPFSLTNPDISFPFTEHETVPLWLLVILGGVVPLVAISIVSLVFVPGFSTKSDRTTSIWREKLWDLHVGWLGLAMSVVSAWFFTQSMKNLYGKPRPDLLSRCEPDMANIDKYIVGGFANSDTSGYLVSAKICQQTDWTKLNDGFCSYPSGHSSFSAAGLIYLSLFLASKLRVFIPGLTPTDRTDTMTKDKYTPKELRHSAAAPPIYLIVIVLVPFGLAVFISSSRWFDFRHHGFDILFGFIMGAITAVLSFKVYHMPISSGGGWAWGSRCPRRAFWAGVGVGTYVTPRPVHWSHSEVDEMVVGSESHTGERAHYDQDIEMQRI